MLMSEHVSLFVCVLYVEMQSVVKFSAREERTGQWSEQMLFPLKPTSHYKKGDEFCVEEHMFIWAMTCLILDWFLLVQSVAMAWWVSSLVWTE